MPVQYGSLPFNEQIAYFRQKANVPTERWADLWKNAHDRGFMVAGATKDDLLADFRLAIDKAIAEGKSLNWFKQQFNDIVARHGWEPYASGKSGSASWRAQVIYETNIRQSYTAGREQQIQQVKNRRPYGIYKHSGAEHPRHDHLSWNNLVIPLDDPWWDTHTPINGYGCKCKKLTASERDLKRLGLKVTAAPRVTTYEWIDKVTGEVHQIPKGIDPGFDYTPKSSAELTEKTQAVVTKKTPLAERLAPRIVDHAFSTVKGVGAESLSNLLAELDSPQVKAFEKALKSHDIKTLFLKAGELSGGKKARAIAEDVEAYLQSGKPNPLWNFTTRRVTRTNGFTAGSWNLVVVKAKASDRFTKVDARQLQQAIVRAIRKGGTDARYWSFSAAAESHLNSSARVVTTWAHEMGHQVYYKAGKPVIPPEVKGKQSLTRYGATNDSEWFAEHFAAWLLASKKLGELYPVINDYINDWVFNLID
ncbi:mu-like prophage Flumu F protein [Photobacterium marinum]|uniref:Mu-like prophage Flumu F protein n=1 Tax=Photobacterium marinum TaxID=1056511 RepID=L8JC74_9GAMM|nr:phage minor head protein [Photobacterium marinum]ELR65858.1 mu-like prophage Flumu F protein [Photobacterium marinum]